MLVLWNTALLVPLTLYFLFWLGLSIYATLASPGILFIALLVLLFVSSVVASVRLKLRILKEVGDSGLAPVRSVYRSATRINVGSYLLFYPVMLGLFSGMGQSNPDFLAFILILVAVVAIPLRLLVSRRKKQYERIRAQYSLGWHLCPKCHVSLGYLAEERRWACFRCGAAFTASMGA